MEVLLLAPGTPTWKLALLGPRIAHPLLSRHGLRARMARVPWVLGSMGRVLSLLLRGSVGRGPVLLTLRP